MFFLNIAAAKKDKDDDSKHVHLLNTLNRIIFRGRSCRKILTCSGWSLLGIYSTLQIKYIIPIITRLVCSGAIVVGGVTISAWLISYFIYEKEEDSEEEEDIIETEQEKYLKFINKDYETFIDIYREKKEDCFTNKNKKFIGELKEHENHETYDLPYSYNPSIIFYYDSESQCFYYYCQSDVNGKILNSVCRTYTINKKCIQLFQDDEEIKYMRKEAENHDNNDNESDISSTDLSLSSSVVSEDSLSLTDEKEEDSGGFVNIFYNKKKRTKQAKEHKEEPLKTNKFIYKGTLDEYDKRKNSISETRSTKRTSYEEYLTSYLK